MCALRPQIAKMCFLLHKVVLNGHFEAYLYNNKCFVVGRCAHRELMRACDTSLEPSSHKNDQVMRQNRLARALRPQCAKMCFLLHKAVLNLRLEVRIAYVN